MESGVRKKRTLAERRESDKLRQRRFRAKKREEARLLQSITGTLEKEKKERVYSLPKKTADEIRETNRIRQQRFRAKRRGEGFAEDVQPMEAEEMNSEVQMTSGQETEAEVQLPQVLDTPMDLVQRILLQAANKEKDRQTEIRREKDRIRKRRERQRKKGYALQQTGLTSEEIIKHKFQKKLEYLQREMDQSQQTMSTSVTRESSNSLEEDDDAWEDYVEEVAYQEDIVKQEPLEPTEEKEENEYFDASHFMAQLEEMGLVLGVVPPSERNEGSPVFEIKQKTSDESESPSSSSVTSNSNRQEVSPFPEKKPWQRCNSSEERRERERMRKRMYRAKQKYISTGKLEMQWDPTPIKRTPNDESEEGITPLPDWTSNFSSEQKLVAHRIYNKRYRERIKSSALREEASRRESREVSLGETSEPANKDFSNLSPDIFKEMLSSFLGKNRVDE